MKVNFKKEPTPPMPSVLISMARFHVMTDMKLGISEHTGEPYYILKFEYVTDLNGVQAILGSIQSDGAIVAQVLDGTNQEPNQHQSQ